MTRRNKSIFETNDSPMRRIIGANLLIWILTGAFWWGTLRIIGIQDIPISRRFGTPLTPEIALLLAGLLWACGLWSLRSMKLTHRRMPARLRAGLLGVVAGIMVMGAAMATAAYRIALVTQG